jgi:hypothetical protein
MADRTKDINRAWERREAERREQERKQWEKESIPLDEFLEQHKDDPDYAILRAVRNSPQVKKGRYPKKLSQLLNNEQVSSK